MNWNFDVFFKNDEDWSNAFTNLKKEIDTLSIYKGKMNDQKMFKEYHLKTSKLMNIAGAVYEYVGLAYNLNMKDNTLASKTQEVINMFDTFQQNTSWDNPEILSLGETTVFSFIDEELEPFRFGFENLFRLQKHVLSSDSEEIIANYSAISNYGDLYNALAISDSTSSTIKLEGKDVLITDGNFRSLITEAKTPEDRKLIFESAFAKYIKNRNTYAGIYSCALKSNWANAKSRKYSSSLESFLYKNNIPTVVFETLIDVTGQYTDGLKRYYNIRKKFFNLDKHHTYDRFMSMASSNKKYSYEESKELFFDSITNMPEEFIQYAHEVLKSGFVDVYEQDGKQTGAFSSGVYGYHPYILLNFDSTLDSCFTLAHEAGHSIHTLFSNSYQPQETADYVIFVAEIASTFNEHMLLDYLVKNSTSKNEKIVLLEQAINDICATFYRQSLFATYEYKAHKLVEEGKSITADTLSNIMIDLYKQYYDIDITTEYGKENVWAYIPHLTKTPFYVYQYATSFSASLKIYENIKDGKENAMENYLSLLKAGGSDYPVNIVKKAGVDLTDRDTYMAVVRRLDNLLDILEKTLNS